MAYYTRRNNLTSGPEPRSVLTTEDYVQLCDVCKDYFDNIAYLWPKFNRIYPNEIEGLDMVAFGKYLSHRIPGLGHNLKGEFVVPSEVEIFDIDCEYTIFDLIELMFEKIRDIDYKVSGFEKLIVFKDTKNIQFKFKDDVDELFEDLGLQYELSVDGLIKRKTHNDHVIESLETASKDNSNQETSDLIRDAIALYRDPSPDARQMSVEKIWDAYERVKSQYDSDKKTSIKIIEDTVSMGNSKIKDQLDLEMNFLTYVGNNYRIRHHEIDKEKIDDVRYLDYLFQRCSIAIVLICNFMEADDKTDS